MGCPTDHFNALMRGTHSPITTQQRCTRGTTCPFISRRRRLDDDSASQRLDDDDGATEDEKTMDDAAVDDARWIYIHTYIYIYPACSRARARDDVMTAAHARGDGAEGTNAPKPRLAIKKMVLENFKSYAGAQHVGPFHKVCAT